VQDFSCGISPSDIAGAVFKLKCQGKEAESIEQQLLCRHSLKPLRWRNRRKGRHGRFRFSLGFSLPLGGFKHGGFYVMGVPPNHVSFKTYSFWDPPFFRNPHMSCLQHLLRDLHLGFGFGWWWWWSQLTLDFSVGMTRSHVACSKGPWGPDLCISGMCKSKFDSYVVIFPRSRFSIIFYSFSDILDS